jgi:tetratricopeptide (TPR) repeat protein
VRETARAVKAEDDTLADYRAATDDAVEQLIGSKPVLGPRERAYLEKSLKRSQAFADRTGDDERSQLVRGEGHFRVAYLWEKLGEQAAARREYAAALAIRKALADAHPAEPDYQQELATTRGNLGGLLADLGERPAARREYEAARDIRKALADAHPAVPDYQIGLGGSYCNLGNLVRGDNQPADSLTWFDRTIDTLTPILAAEPRDVSARQFLRNSYWGPGDGARPVGAVRRGRA